MKALHPVHRRFRPFGVLAVLALGATLGLAQPTFIGKGKNFSISPDFYPAPHHSQMKSLLRGGEAVTTADGLIQLKQARLQTYRVDGSAELTVEAPEAVYDSEARSVSSPGSLLAQTVDGKFSINGEGFHWQQTNSTLVISNRVKTFIHPDLLEKGNTTAPAAAAKADEGLRIESDTFQFDVDSGTGTYAGHVRVAGTNLALTSGQLKILVPTSTRQLQSITAEQNIVADYGGIHATGQRAVYTATNGLVHVTGQPAWRMPDREGRADAVQIDPTNRVVVATGNSYIKLAGQRIGPAGLLSVQASPGPRAAATNTGIVEIRSDYCEVRTNRAVFRDQVQVTDRDPQQPPGTMTCQLLTVTYSGTNQVNEVRADGKVRIVQADKTIYGDRAVYDGTNAVLEITGSPTWIYGPRQGRGEVIRINSKTEEMTVVGEAYMRVPATEFGKLAVGGTNAPSAATAPKASAEFAELIAGQYAFRQGQARFVDKVFITHPRMNWACEEMTVRFPEGAAAVDQIVAERSVKFDLVNERGQQVHGEAGKAVYTYEVKGGVTNDFMVLTGNPFVQRVDPATGNPTVFRNDVIIYDRTRNQIAAPGQVSILGYGKFAETNLLPQGNSGFLK